VSRRSDPHTERKYERSIPVATFLGGFILATLTGLFSLRPDNPIFCNNANSLFCSLVICVSKGLPASLSWIDYRQFLFGYIGLVGIFFIISVFVMKAAFVRQVKTGFTEFSHILYKLGVVGILLLLPMIVSSFSQVGIIIFLVVIALIILDLIQRYKWKHQKVVFNFPIWDQ
jgi:hypothetical protein